MILDYSVCPTYWYTQTYLGGWSFSPTQISFELSLIGIAQAIWVLIVFPYTHRRVGSRAVLKFCAITRPLIFVLYPLLSLLRHLGHRTAFFVLAYGTSALVGSSGMAYGEQETIPESMAITHARRSCFGRHRQ